jgi:transposase
VIGGLGMHLKVGKSNGRDYLSIVHGYRDHEGKSRTKTIRSLGYLDALKEKHKDPIKHFRSVVEEMNKKDTLENIPLVMTIDREKRLDAGCPRRRNLGYAALSRIYHELDLGIFFGNHARKLKVDYNINSIAKLLVFSRILAPASKKKTFTDKGMYFDRMDFSLDDVYRSLSFLNGWTDALQRHLHGRIKDQYGRSTEMVYYDVTNYYFEIDEPDDLRKKGVSKEHRPNPIVQMGLFIDNMGLPISYELFPGNTNDCLTMRPILSRMKREYGIGRMIVVADKGLNTSDNIAYTLLRKDGYVFSQRVRGASKELSNWIFDERGYRQIDVDFRIKSRLYPKNITVTTLDGKRKDVRVDEKQVVFYSRDYDRKAKAQREPALAKARDLVDNPAKYNRATAYGAAKYVKNLQYDKKTGEILMTKSKPIFDEDKLREEEQFDGYYAIITSECYKSDEEILDIYRGLWRIEESFRLVKGDLEARPVYLSREEHIRAHFMICFLALVIARILEYRLKNEYSISRIIESLRKSSCTPLEENWYVLDHTDEITAAIRERLGIDLGHKYLCLGDIRKILGDTKKS